MRNTYWDVEIKAGLIVSRNYRMQIFWIFQSIEEYIVSNLQYRVSRYWFILSFSAENFPEIPKNLQNSPKIQKILQKFRKFRKLAEISENSPKIPQKEDLFWGQNIVSISYLIEKKSQISYRYRIESKKNISLRGGRNVYWWKQIKCFLIHVFCRAVFVICSSWIL